MPPASPAALQLSQSLRQLRQSRPRLTQRSLAAAFSTEDRLSAVTVSSWESPADPKLPPMHRLEAYARFFSTSRSKSGRPELLPADDLTPEESRKYKAMEAELAQ